jgi:hypothetical protein
MYNEFFPRRKAITDKNMTPDNENTKQTFGPENEESVETGQWK